jgi:hypothetical protein
MEVADQNLGTNSERVSPPLGPAEVWKIADSVAGRYRPGVPTQEGAA